MRVMIVDDERPSIEELEYLLGQYSDIRIIGVYTNALQALASVKTSIPDAVFLDIAMPQMNGIELARNINSVNAAIKIVLVTANSLRLMDAKQAPPFVGLLKPISDIKLNSVVDYLRMHLKQET